MAAKQGEICAYDRKDEEEMSEVVGHLRGMDKKLLELSGRVEGLEGAKRCAVGARQRIKSMEVGKQGIIR